MADEGRRQTWVQDAATMRALSHPARIKVLDRLFAGVPATATELAEVCGLSPSATSYHLRALARAGLIEEAPGRGDGRERLWRSQHRGLYVATGPERGAAEQAADRELSAVFLELEEARARDWLARRDAEPYEWYRASSSAGFNLMVTAEELQELNERVLALLEPYTRQRRADPPDGARPVNVTYRSFPSA